MTSFAGNDLETRRHNAHTVAAIPELPAKILDTHFDPPKPGSIQVRRQKDVHRVIMSGKLPAWLRLMLWPSANFP